MSKQPTLYRNNLPQLGSKLFITDGGLETTLLFLRELELPLFAAFPLIDSDEGLAHLQAYFEPYLDIAIQHKAGMILDTPTWRASHGWGNLLGYSAVDIQFFNEASIDLAAEIRERRATADTPIVINGVIGPQDGGYNPNTLRSIDASHSYHSHQVEVLARTQADMITALTLTYAEEAIGLTRAACEAEIPVAISFTVETDGRLPNGMSLQQAIEITDDSTYAAPVYYMINCAHPSHFAQVLDANESWLERIYGVRANASCMSHAELDEATELDDGNPQEFGQDYALLKKRLPNLNVVGGCCGTDYRHIGEICRTLVTAGGADEQRPPDQSIDSAPVACSI